MILNIIALTILTSLSLLAQTSPTSNSPEDINREILMELRSVHQTLKRSLATQAQLLLSSEQVKIAYQYMTSRSERLEAIRGELALIHASLLQAGRTADTLDSQFNQTVDPEQKGNIERQLKEQKSLITEQQQREAELRESEVRILREVQDSQYRMEQASSTLAAIAGQLQQELKSFS